MRPQVAHVDPEPPVVDLLTDLLGPIEPAVTVGVGVPDDWNPAWPPHVEVALDGTVSSWPIYADHPVRLVARAGSTSRAKDLALVCEGLLLARGSSDRIASITPGIGLLAARDPETRAEMASVTVNVRMRTAPLPSGS